MTYFLVRCRLQGLSHMKLEINISQTKGPSLYFHSLRYWKKYLIIDCITKLKPWFDYNKLTLNFSKTKFIIFRNLTNSIARKLMINNIELEKVAEIKLLGGDNTSQPGYPTLSQSLCPYQLTSRSVFALFCGCILVLVQKQDSLVSPHTWFSHVPVPDVLIVTSFLKEWQLFSPPWVVFFFNS